MTTVLQTLKCSECGSGALRRTGLNQYVCEHCGARSVIEDGVSDRLDRVLEQVKDAAAERLAAEQSRNLRISAEKLFQYGLITAAVVVVLGLLFAALNHFSTKEQLADGSRASLPKPDSAIPVDGLKLDEGRQVLVGSGSSAKAKLLVIARNETGKPLERPGITAVLYSEGGNKLGTASETLPASLLAAGETAPVLVDLPGDKTVTRHELQVQRLSTPHRSVEGPRLAFSRVRLVQDGKSDLRLAGRIVNTRKDVTLVACEVLVTAYDDTGALIGFGRGYAQSGEVKPGERTAVDVRIPRFGGSAAAVAAWDYRISYAVKTDESSRTPVISADRVIRTNGAPETFGAGLRMSTEDLLAEDSERFDLSQLELLPLVAGRSQIQRPLYLTEVVNRSKDMIAITPGGVISQYDGSQAGGSVSMEEIAYLYPGERLPIRLEPQKTGQITQTRVEWKPSRRAALPGSRTPLVVQVEGTRAQTGSVLLNFSQRFSYKYVEVKGSVKNAGTAIVRKPRVWISLRDRDGRLTGFRRVDNLPAIAPGESVPFQVDVEQNGGDFTAVSSFYQSTE
jgi:DNA-directed RNA polymerase subunit RPC12/RpoP